MTEIISKENRQVEVSEINNSFLKVTNNIRDDIKNSPYIEEAFRVLPVGGYRSAIGSFWNAVVDDLRNKIIHRGLHMFNKEMSLRRMINCYDDFIESVNDEELIEGAYKIGVIGLEARRILKHSKEVRHFFSGHPGSSEPSPIKLLSFMEDCVEYVLNQEFPAQIIDIDEYIERLANEDFDRNEIAITNALSDLPIIYKTELSNRIFQSYLKDKPTTILRSNIEFVAPILWKHIDKDRKLQIVRSLDRIIPEGNKTKIDHGIKFVEIVEGQQFLSQSSKEYIIKPILEDLVDSFGDFNREGKLLRLLLKYSAIVPLTLTKQYVHVITKSFVGYVGHSMHFSRTDFYANAAGIIVPEMFQKFDDNLIEIFVNYIRESSDIRKVLRRHPEKLRRFRELGLVLEERVSATSKNKKVIDYLINEEEEERFFSIIK